MKLFADNIPIYLQLKAEVEEAILNSSLRAEEALESIRAMAARYRINPLTVSKAVQELEDEGIIYKKRGIGFYITTDAYDLLRRKYMQTYLEAEVKSFVQKARQLKLSLSEVVKLLEESYSKSSHSKLDLESSEKEIDSRLRGNDNVKSNPAHHPDNVGLRPSTPNEEEKIKSSLPDAGREPVSKQPDSGLRRKDKENKDKEK